MLATAVEKHIVLLCFRNFHMAAVFHVVVDFFDSFIANWHQSLFVAFANNAYELFFEMQIVHAQINQFTYSKSTTVERFKYGTIPMTFGFAYVYYSYNFINFGNCEINRQFSWHFGRFKQIGRVGINEVVYLQIGEKTFNSRDNSSL